jgi:hypothetical protein
LWVIRDGGGPPVSPAMSAMPPKAEVNSEHERLRYGRDSSSETGASNQRNRLFLTGA